MAYEVSNTELKNALVKSTQILEEAEYSKQSYLEGISKGKLVIVPMGVLEVLHTFGQVELMKREKTTEVSKDQAIKDARIVKRWDKAV
jgi:hypothetical protein